MARSKNVIMVRVMVNGRTLIDESQAIPVEADKPELEDKLNDVLIRIDQSVAEALDIEPTLEVEDEEEGDTGGSEEEQD